MMRDGGVDGEHDDQRTVAAAAVVVRDHGEMKALSAGGGDPG